MPPANLSVDWGYFQDVTRHVDSLLASAAPLHIRHRKIIAEMAVIRLFLLTEHTLASCCLKLLCGTNYLDGTLPKTAVQASSISNAARLVRSHGRQKRIRGVMAWGNMSNIQHYLRYTFDSGDPIFLAVASHTPRLDEIRYIRNHIAHSNDSTRRSFRGVVRSHYGGLRRGVTPGVLLLTEAFGTPTPLQKYTSFLRVFIKDVVRA